MAKKETKQLTVDQQLEKKIKEIEKILKKDTKVDKPTQTFFHEGLEECYEEHVNVFSLLSSLADLNTVEATARVEKIDVVIPGIDNKGNKTSFTFGEMRAELRQEIKYRQNRELRKANEETLADLRQMLSDEQKEQAEKAARTEAIAAKLARLNK